MITVSAQRTGTDVEIHVVETTASAFRRSCYLGCSSCSPRWTVRAHRAQGGLGIGLALVRQLVQMHGGNVTAYSQGPGRGQRVPDSIAVAARGRYRGIGAVGLDPTPWRRLPREGGKTGHRILLADDNRDALDSLATLLQCDGHERPYRRRWS